MKSEFVKLANDSGDDGYMPDILILFGPSFNCRHMSALYFKNVSVQIHEFTVADH